MEHKSNDEFALNKGDETQQEHGDTDEATHLAVDKGTQLNIAKPVDMIPAIDIPVTSADMTDTNKLADAMSELQSSINVLINKLEEGEKHES